MLGHVEAVRSAVCFGTAVVRCREALSRWFVAHWHGAVAVVGIGVAVALLATAAVPPLLAPFVLGPVGAVVVTVLIAPKAGPTGAAGPSRDAAAPQERERERRAA